MTSSRQVAHIQMFSQFPSCVCVSAMCMRACIAWHTPRWWPPCSLNNITTGAVYTIMTCTARGPTTSVAPFLHLCLSVFTSFCLCFSLCLSTSLTCNLSTSLLLSLVCYAFSHSLQPHFSQQHYYWGGKIAKLTSQRLNACLTWHLSATINKHIIHVSWLEKVGAAPQWRAECPR